MIIGAVIAVGSTRFVRSQTAHQPRGGLLIVAPYAPAEAKTAALAEFNDPGPAHINCCQAVVRFAVLVLGCDPGLVTVGRYFGGGIAGMGETCGAITGTAMALGMRDLCLGERVDEFRPRTVDSPEADAIAISATTFGCRRCATSPGSRSALPRATTPSWRARSASAARTTWASCATVLRPCSPIRRARGAASVAGPGNAGGRPSRDGLQSS